MFAFDCCAEPGCQRLAFAGQDRCLRHLPDAERAIARAAELLAAGAVVKDLNIDGAALDGIDLSKRHFYGCSFIGVSLRSVLFTNATFVLCFFDRAALESCDFSTADAQYCSFGGSDIQNSSFENSELIHCSFDGSRMRESTFNGSNLYDSRFIDCELENVDFVDCDLKRVYLIPDKERNVSYKGSNTMEAIRDLEHLYL